MVFDFFCGIKTKKKKPKHPVTKFLRNKKYAEYLKNKFSNETKKPASLFVDAGVPVKQKGKRATRYNQVHHFPFSVRCTITTHAQKYTCFFRMRPHDVLFATTKLLLHLSVFGTQILQDFCEGMQILQDECKSCKNLAKLMQMLQEKSRIMYLPSKTTGSHSKFS